MTLAGFSDRARALDAADTLKGFREQFAFPQRDGKPVVYLVGNSLGLMPHAARDVINRELDAWSHHGVEGHFADASQPHAPTTPWFDYHALFADRGAALVGARASEIVAMGSLTSNLHLLMVSFFRPSGKRTKICIEGGAFPSDRWAVQSQVQFHGYDTSHVIELQPRDGEALLHTDDVLRVIEEQGDSIALFLMSGVNYYTGQRYDITRITRAAKAKGITVGWDLAHAAGNVLMNLHDDDVDFAAWCTYKYLNAGPGSVAMAFVHERHHHALDLPRFVGWWSSDPATRFAMAPTVKLQTGAAGWQISNAPVLSMAALHASLTLFQQATLPALRAKSEQLTSMLFEIVDAIVMEKGPLLSVITPRAVADRGAQLSLRMTSDPQRFLQLLQARGVFADFRKPDVIRVAPAPLYCSFDDVVRFGHILRDAL